MVAPQQRRSAAVRTDGDGQLPNATAAIRLVGRIRRELSDDWVPQNARCMAAYAIGAESDAAPVSQSSVHG